MNRIKGIVVVSSLAMAALLLIAVSSMASVVTNIDVPINGAVINPCNGETVTFTGVDHIVSGVTLDGGGGFHLSFHDNIHVTAAGSQGNSYEGNEEDNAELNGRFGVEQTIVNTFSEISKGSAPNFEIHALLHITVNPNGSVTVFFSHFSASCRA